MLASLCLLTRLVMTRFAVCALLGFALGTSAALAQTKISNGMLTGPNGMTLYTFDKDAAGSGKSACTGPCEKLWPPFTANASDKAAGDYSLIARDDGNKQWAYKGKPLYFWSKDQKSGDMTGDGFNKIWHVAKP